MTIFEKAQLGEISDEMALVADLERINPQNVVNSVSKGRAVIMTRTGFNPVGIGHVFRTKINVNLGTSTSVINFEDELEKLKVATEYGADTISDLSMGGKIDEIRKKILSNSSIPITTVPIYQTVMEAGSLGSVSEDLMINVIRKQVNDGISSVVIHAGFTLEDLRGMKGKRIMGMVSKGEA